MDKNLLVMARIENAVQHFKERQGQWDVRRFVGTLDYLWLEWFECLTDSDREQYQDLRKLVEASVKFNQELMEQEQCGGEDR